MAVAEAAAELTGEVAGGSIVSYVLAERRRLLAYGEHATDELPEPRAARPRESTASALIDLRFPVGAGSCDRRRRACTTPGSSPISEVRQSGPSGGASLALGFG